MFYGRLTNMKWLKGQIGLGSIIGWGLALAMSVTGFMWSKISATDSQIETTKIEQSKTVERVAKIEEAVLTIKEDNKIIKDDIKTLLRRIK